MELINEPDNCLGCAGPQAQTISRRKRRIFEGTEEGPNIEIMNFRSMMIHFVVISSLFIIDISCAN